MNAFLSAQGSNLEAQYQNTLKAISEMLNKSPNEKPVKLKLPLENLSKRLLPSLKEISPNKSTMRLPELSTCSLKAAFAVGVKAMAS